MSLSSNVHDFKEAHIAWISYTILLQIITQHWSIKEITLTVRSGCSLRSVLNCIFFHPYSPCSRYLTNFFHSYSPCSRSNRITWQVGLKCNSFFFFFLSFFCQSYLQLPGPIYLSVMFIASTWARVFTIFPSTTYHNEIWQKWFHFLINEVYNSSIYIIQFREHIKPNNQQMMTYLIVELNKEDPNQFWTNCWLY